MFFRRDLSGVALEHEEQRVDIFNMSSWQDPLQRLADYDQDLTCRMVGLDSKTLLWFALPTACLV
jgi:hypothetical protein